MMLSPCHPFSSVLSARPYVALQALLRDLLDFLIFLLQTHLQDIPLISILPSEAALRLSELLSLEESNLAYSLYCRHLFLPQKSLPIAPCSQGRISHLQSLQLL